MMDLDALPLHARACPGESLSSWLDATRQALQLTQAEWQSMGAAGLDDTAALQGAPSGLGRVSAVPRRWRLHPNERWVTCPQCLRPGGIGPRPTLTEWVDARRFWCRQHGLLLHPSDWRDREGGPATELDSELELASRWIDTWIGWEREAAATRQRDSRAAWAHDLLRICTANLSPMAESAPAEVMAWELEQRLGVIGGAQKQRVMSASMPLLGQLPFRIRLGALLGAYRLWLVTEERACGQPLPSLTLAGWAWLLSRRSCRAQERRTSLAAQMQRMLANTRVRTQKRGQRLSRGVRR